MILDRRPASEVKKAAHEEGMRFLRESAVEKVLHGHDDAARNQQGDVRRMSCCLTSWLASPPPDAAVEMAPERVSAATLGTRGARARRCRPTRFEAAARRGVDAVADRARTSSTAPPSWPRCAPWSDGSAAPARVALVVPDLADARLAGPLRPGAPRARRPRPADALAGQEVRAVPDRGGLRHLRPGARVDRRRRASSSSCWRAATSSAEYEGVCEERGHPRRARRPVHASAS